MDNNITQNQVENNSEIKAITGGEVKSPQYLEQLDATAHSAKLVYYMWMSRLLVLLSVISMSFLVLASLALFRLAPRVTVEPLLLVNNSTSDDLVSNEAIAFDMPSREALLKMYIRQYVKLRNTIIHDRIEMQSRWMAGGMVHFLSTPKVYNEFGASVASKWEQIVSQPVTREVEIMSVKQQGGKNSRMWTVDFKTYDLPNTRGTRASAESVTVRYWTTSLQVAFIPERAFSFYRLINPLGFTVLWYSQTDKQG